MKTIWKYYLDITDRQTLRMPKGAVILSVENQYGALCCWAMVDPACDEDEDEDRPIALIRTGRDASGVEPHEYVGTVTIDSFVWHVFDVRRNAP